MLFVNAFRQNELPWVFAHDLIAADEPFDEW